ncbi:hypothetical protein SAMN05421505_11183 [Sinosporangium album]|uniref:Uncharacterized protein n=1 Tax=Sinosporangium album TaxID=504805 RepID=A0A1G7ZLG2_9ACTN|nr:hypothetical protein [Sinosporangium album]SDH08940.1 hypothetical protein SAMN05421505_11183 [Sinosporangium album]
MHIGDEGEDDGGKFRARICSGCQTIVKIYKHEMATNCPTCVQALSY